MNRSAALYPSWIPAAINSRKSDLFSILISMREGASSRVVFRHSTEMMGNRISYKPLRTPNKAAWSTNSPCRVVTLLSSPWFDCVMLMPPNRSDQLSSTPPATRIRYIAGMSGLGPIYISSSKALFDSSGFQCHQVAASHAMIQIHPKVTSP